ncbi:MAG: transposase [Candidatus Zapsychrus exili]|nr:transposase [Candidatus Zapsychrus exili]
MVAIKRLYYESSIYHVISRGNNRQKIFKDKRYKEYFLDILRRYKERYSFKIYGYVLMDNHFHIVIETIQKHNISKIMQGILLSYSVKYRKENEYVGYVWQGRFKSKIIESKEYILECLEYIHNNPVKASIVEYPEQYHFSSARFYGDLSEEDTSAINICDTLVC